MFYDDRGTLGGLLGLVVENYESERAEYWGEDAQGKLLLGFVDSVARTLLDSSRDMVAKPLELEGLEFHWRQVEHLASEVLLPQIQERLEIEVAYEVTDGLSGSADRTMKLARLVLRERPNATVTRFLQRLSRCFIVGFLPECVMLCRGVLENAISDAFDRKSVPLPADSSGHSTMRKKLDAAVLLKIMTPAARADADMVWARGNTAVHHDPEATRDVYGTIEKTLRVLKELYE